MTRDLSGRCGSCAYFIPLEKDAEDRSIGECRLGCWPAPLGDTATCANYTVIGGLRASNNKSPRQKRSRTEYVPPVRRLPKEIDLDMDTEDLKAIFRDVLRDELGITEADMAERWRGGELVLVPAKEGIAEKRLSIEALFHKVVMIRDKLRVLEQKINTNPKLDDEEKVQLQHYITGCYGSLTTFNILFQSREVGFVGAGKDD